MKYDDHWAWAATVTTVLPIILTFEFLLQTYVDRILSISAIESGLTHFERPHSLRIFTLSMIHFTDTFTSLIFITFYVPKLSCVIYAKMNLITFVQARAARNFSPVIFFQIQLDCLVFLL